MEMSESERRSRAARKAWATRRRLKREALKDRKSLKGLDRYFFMAALDDCVAGKFNCPIAAHRFHGRVPVFEIVDINRYQPSLILPHIDEKHDWLFGAAVAYFRILYCPNPLHELLQGQLGDQFRNVWIMCQKGAGLKVEQVPVYPAVSILTLFSAIWPEHWRQFAGKYLDGYTGLAVQTLEDRDAHRARLVYDSVLRKQDYQKRMAQFIENVKRLGPQYSPPDDQIPRC